MKQGKTLLAATCCLLLTTIASATSWTVSNNPDRPAQFTDIQSAIDAASPNDTILITGGTYSTAINIVKPIVFYGESIEGSEFPVTHITVAINLQRFNSSLSSDGSRFYGIRMNTLYINPSFSGAGAGQQTLDDIIVERCHFSGGTYIYPYDGVSNLTMRNCLFTNSTVYFNYQGQAVPNISSFLMTNCVFDNTLLDAFYNSSDYDMNGNVVVRNSLFFNKTTSCFADMLELVVENCIFYKAEPTGLSLSTFNNNLTYLCNSNTIPYGDNLGSGNIENQDPLFANYPALGGAHSWDWDYTPQAGSPAIGTGTNGTDMGLGGGNAPVANLPRYAKIPGVTLLEIPVSSVPVGGTLQINIEAESRD